MPSDGTSPAEIGARSRETACMARPLILVDRDSGEPLYRQVRRAIEHSIAAGTIASGGRLPSSRQLAAELGISRNTVNLAYQELASDGTVVSQQRRGLFVNPEMRHAKSFGSPPTARLDWSTRLRRRPDAGMQEIEKILNWHDYPYPFVAGQSDIQSFPVRAWLRSLREALYHPHIYASLQDSVASDDAMLVEQVRTKLLPARGIDAAAEEILITVGSQQGLDLLTRVLLLDGRRIAVEDPGYLDAQHIFVWAGAQIVPLPVDERGVQPPESLSGLEAMYVTPSHHHPTNVTLSMDRRIAVLAMARDSGTLVIEDDYDSEFRYQGSPSPALKALDRSGNVVYLGTFSKFLAPGLRLGFIVAPAELVAEMRNVRRYVLRHPSGHQQRAMALLIASGDYQRSLRRYRRRLMEKWAVATAAAGRYLPWEQTPYPPGGVSLWVSAPEGFDAVALVARAARRGVLIERGDIYFAHHPRPRNHFRIGYPAVPVRRIEEGIALLGAEARALLPD